MSCGRCVTTRATTCKEEPPFDPSPVRPFHPPPPPVTPIHPSPVTPFHRHPQPRLTRPPATLPPFTGGGRREGHLLCDAQPTPARGLQPMGQH
eukprot:3491127-Prymnesium_polylepis.1